MSDKGDVKAEGKKIVTPKQALAIMVIGGILLVLSVVVPTEQGTTAQYLKIGVGAFGIALFFFGSYQRPKKA